MHHAPPSVVSLVAAAGAVALAPGADAREAVLEAGFSSIAPRVSGATGAILLPGLPGTPGTFSVSGFGSSVAVAGETVYFTTTGGFPTGPGGGDGRLFATPLAGGPVTEVLGGLGETSVIAVDAQPYLVDYDRRGGQIDIRAVSGGVASEPVFSTTLGGFASPAQVAAGYDAARGEVLLFTPPVFTTSGDDLLAVSTADWQTVRRGSSGSQGFGGSAVNLIAGAGDGRAYINRSPFDGGRAIDLDRLTGTDEPLPGFARPLSRGFPLSTSDAFDLDYGPGDDAAAAVRLVVEEAGPTLLRTPYTWSADARLANWVVPDETVVDGVRIDRFYTQTLPAGVDVVERPAAAAGLAERSLGAFDVTVDPTGMEVGFVSLNPRMELTGSYTDPAGTGRRGVDITRTFSSGAAFPFSVAVDPASENFVGNGEADLRTAGWRKSGSPDFRFSTVTEDAGDPFFRLAGDPSSFGSLVRSDLQLGTPDDAALISFDVRVESEDGVDEVIRTYADIVGTIDGQRERIEFWRVDSLADTAGWQTLSFRIEDPRLGVLQDAEISFGFVNEGPDADGFRVELDRIRLTAVPEPAAAVVLLGLAGFRRRRRGGG